jgi:hypothetical protein
MNKLFNKPILEQMFEFRKEDFEQTIYDENDEIKEIQSKICDKYDTFIKYLENVIPNKEELEKAQELFNSYDLELSGEVDFWSRMYFKLGMTDMAKMKNELYENKAEMKDEDTFLNYEGNGLSEWIEMQKRKYTLGTKEYKELQKRYNEISKKYPNAIEVFENLKPIGLTNEEMKALVELREIDIDMGCMEKNLAFKLGINEILNF